ncbi:MAG: hypothetical protein M1812_004248 [Candelaria pacifica]|nr:MAG: hypothetical protein M1812_004248 [Candelaria pacifica]
MAPQIINIGIIGCGEVFQVIHLPTLLHLTHLYKILSISDLSTQTLSHIQHHHPSIPTTTTDPYSIINSPSITLILLLTSDEYHETYTLASLHAGKNVFVEKPLTLSLQSAERIVEAEKTAKNGARVFVGYMRRYAPSFVNSFKREIEGIDRVLYARCRGIVGPNEYFVNQSGIGSFKSSGDDIPKEKIEESHKLVNGLFSEVFEGREITQEKKDFVRFLGSLGSHDLSLMREVLGFPQSVSGVSVHALFYSAILEFKNSKKEEGGEEEKFALMYESGIDSVPRFDSHLAVYGKNKSVCIQYDTPYIKGLPIKVRVEEMNRFGEVVCREIIGSYEDAYTAELKELYACLSEGKRIKTGVEDALLDLRLCKMLFVQYERQMQGRSV